MNRSHDSSKNRPASRLASLLRRGELWQAGHLETPPESAVSPVSQRAIPSGFAALDRHLPGGGWPVSGLAELLLGTAGVGELRLLAPLMATLSHRQARWVAWVAPPFVPYAPALEACGVDIGRLLLVQPHTHRQALWALEQAARSGSCSLILAWLDERRLRQEDTRRLKLAARRGDALICLFRPAQAAGRPSLAELRLQLAPGESGTVTVDLRKRRGGWPVSGIRVQLDGRPGAEAVREQLALWRQWQRRRDAALSDRQSGYDNGHNAAANLPRIAPAPSGVVH